MIIFDLINFKMTMNFNTLPAGFEDLYNSLLFLPSGLKKASYFSARMNLDYYI